MKTKVNLDIIYPYEQEGMDHPTERIKDAELIADTKPWSKSKDRVIVLRCK